MHSLFEKLSHILIGDERPTLELRELSITFEKDSGQVLKHLQVCKRSGGVLGIYSSTLGAGMFLVTVVQIIQNKTVVLREVGPQATAMSKILLNVGEISAVCPFNQLYVDHAYAEDQPATTVLSHIN